MRRTQRALLGALLLVALLGGLPARAAEQPRYGGIVTWFDYADPARLDVHTESPLGVQQATAGVYSGLLQYDPENPSQIIADLAERWEASADGTVYTFHLRRGVQWHDGQPFSAADVQATFDRILAPDFRSPRCGSLLKPLVERVETVDDFTVRFHLKFPAATFIPSVASAWCRIAAKHILERDGNLQDPKSQIGTGPFRFKRYERGSLIEWERNPNYYDKRYPYVDGVVQYILKGAARQLAAAKAGKIMLWDTWPPMTRSQAEELKNARGDKIEIYVWPINTVWAVHLNTTRPPFDNPDLRLAVHLALNRQELFDKVFEGVGVPCAILDPKLYGDWALPMEEVKAMPGCRQPKTQDLEEAKRLVAKHYPNGLDIEVAVRSVGNYIDRVQLVVAQLRDIGIRGTIKTYESAAGYSVYGKGDFTVIGTQDTAMFLSDPSAPFAILFTSQAGRNWARHSDPLIDKLADEGLREQNRDKRREIYHRLQRHLLAGGNGTVIVGWVEGWFFRDKRLRNYHPANTVYDNNTFMKVWISK
ncbi:MAG: peptide ABC transporter substrate-binding protein [Candidatus Tectimicrobiota bacterium]|nr:MAG: peptide ABC transporter substrate-binding protein [Candidatus Tectomicrobia bacterium]